MRDDEWLGDDALLTAALTGATIDRVEILNEAFGRSIVLHMHGRRPVKLRGDTDIGSHHVHAWFADSGSS